MSKQHPDDSLTGLLRQRSGRQPGLSGIIGNIGWLLLDKAVRMVVGLLVGVWVARYLGPHEYGLFSFAFAFIILFGAIATLGLDSIMVRELVSKPGQERVIMGSGFVLRLLGGLLSFIIIVLFISYLRPGDPLARTIVAMFGFIHVMSATEVIKYWFESQVRSKYVVWVENGVILLVAGVKVAMIIMGAPLMAFVVATFSQAVLVSLLLVVLYRVRVAPLSDWQVELARARELLRDGWPLAFAGVAVAVYMQIDRIMLGQMTGDSVVGIYSAAARISETWYFVPMAIVPSVFPSILRARNRSLELYRQRFQKLYNIMVLLTLLIVVPIALFSGPVINLLYGSAYAPAAGILSIHIWALCFGFLGAASARWFLAENRQMLVMQRSLLGAAINIGLNFLLIPRYGATGAAITTVVSVCCADMLYDLLQKETRPMFFMKLKAFNIYQSARSLLT